MIVTTVFLVLYIVPEFYLFLKIVKPALEHKIVHEPAVGGGATEKTAGAIGGGAGTQKAHNDNVAPGSMV